MATAGFGEFFGILYWLVCIFGGETQIKFVLRISPLPLLFSARMVVFVIFLSFGSALQIRNGTTTILKFVSLVSFSLPFFSFPATFFKAQLKFFPCFQLYHYKDWNISVFPAFEDNFNFTLPETTTNTTTLHEHVSLPFVWSASQRCCISWGYQHQHALKVHFFGLQGLTNHQLLLFLLPSALVVLFLGLGCLICLRRRFRFRSTQRVVFYDNVNGNAVQIQ